LSPPDTFRLGGDLEVRRLGYGAMRLCGPGIIGWPDDRENALAVLRRVVELGVTFIDTADAYGPHVNELQIAEALHPYPEGLVVATKGGLLHDRTSSWPPDGRPEHLREACEGSLLRLRLDRIDVYQLHRPDPSVPLEESVWHSAQFIVPGSPLSCDPMWVPACQIPKTAPAGSAATVIRPESKTSNGSIITVPPAWRTELAIASTSSAAR
jgi:hypothetical protein